MADLDVALTIGSEVGYRRSSTQTFIDSTGTIVEGGIDGPRPIVTTLLYLNGNTGTEAAFTGTKILSVSTTTPFIMAPGDISDPQDIYITNEGSSPLTVLTLKRSQDGANFNFEGFEPITGIVAPGSTGTLSISYTGGPTLGEFYNYVLIVTDADNPQFKLITRQIITDAALFQVTATTYSTSTVITAYGEAFDFAYSVEATLDGVVLDPSLITYTGNVVAGAGWEVLGVGPSGTDFLVRFDSNNVNDVNGVYASDITITGTYGGFSDTITTVNSATVQIDANLFKNLGYWISPAANYNSVIGASYDLINGVKYLTIGVGTGADGTPTYDQGGDSYVSVITLGIKAGPLAVRNNPYLGWANVWRFPISGSPATYYSNATDDGNNYLYKQKTTSGLDYEYYFGTESST